MSFDDSDWPKLDQGYTDEFGDVDAIVNDAAGKIWPRCRRFALSKLGDDATGQQLLFKAVVLVSRVVRDSAEPLGNLAAYLNRTFNRLVLTEMRSRERQYGHAEELGELPDASTIDPDDLIYLYEILERVDVETRQIFELLLLGHTYEEIALMLGLKANFLRNKVSRANKKIRQQLNPKK